MYRHQYRRPECIECPACGGWTLDLNDDIAGSRCEVCDYKGAIENGDREDPEVHALRLLRAEVQYYDPRTNRIAWADTVRRCASLADELDIPRMIHELGVDTDVDPLPSPLPLRRSIP